MSWQALAETFVTLFVIMDPVGNVPIFIALVGRRSARERRLAAVQAALAAGLLVAGFALFGRAVLDYLHVTVDSLTIAGGLLLLLVALQAFRGEELPAEDAGNIALVPLATPLLAGPGAIAAIMVLAGRHESFGGRVGVMLGVAAVVVVVAVALLFAGQISRVLRPAAIHFLSRVFALLLSSIAVQLIIDAVRHLVTAGA